MCPQRLITKSFRPINVPFGLFLVAEKPHQRGGPAATVVTSPKYYYTNQFKSKSKSKIERKMADE